MVFNLITVFIFNVFEQIGVIADFAQLDQDVLVVRHRVSFLNHSFLEQVPINLLLLLSDANLHVNFNLGRQAFLDFFFNATEQEGLQNTVQLLDHVLVSLLFFCLRHFYFSLSQVEPLVKVVRRRKDLWKQEIEQTPKLMEVVLEGGSR